MSEHRDFNDQDNEDEINVDHQESKFESDEAFIDNNEGYEEVIIQKSEDGSGSDKKTQNDKHNHLQELKERVLKLKKERPSLFYFFCLILLISIISLFSGDETESTSGPETISSIDSQSVDDAYNASIDEDLLVLQDDPITGQESTPEKMDSVEFKELDETQIETLEPDEVDNIINDLASNESEDSTFNGIDTQTQERITSLELTSSTINGKLNDHVAYTNSEIEQLLASNKELVEKLSSIEKEVSQKRYDLGYEKDRPQIKLESTVNAPENCKTCVAHASFVYEDINYQVGNGGKWHDFDVEVNGNRLTLTKNEYVYDFWVSQ